METNGRKHRVGRHAEHGERLQPVREREFDGHNTYAGGLDKSEGELEYFLHGNVTPPFIFLYATLRYMILTSTKIVTDCLYA